MEELMQGMRDSIGAGTLADFGDRVLAGAA